MMILLLLLLLLFILTLLFLSPHFSFLMCDKHNVVISKVHYEFIIFLEFIRKNNDDFY
jgi:hypothetical protein